MCLLHFGLEASNIMSASMPNTVINIASTTVFLATSVVEACVVERCFIGLELLTTHVDKHLALGHNVHFTCMFLPFTSKRLK